jgi:uncharacterized protein with HEPN domain
MMTHHYFGIVLAVIWLIVALALLKLHHFAVRDERDDK